MSGPRPGVARLRSEPPSFAGARRPRVSRRTLLSLSGAAALTALLARPRLATARLRFTAGGDDGPPRAGESVPRFSAVEWVDADEALQFLGGRHPRYPGAGLDTMRGYSAADILETTDTDVLDTVQAQRGSDALATLYQIIARHALDSLIDVYGDAPVVLALDAGHGGKPGVFYDPGSNGTEAVHTRAVAGAIEQIGTERRYGAVTVRRIFNDAIGDDFGLPEPEGRRGAAALVLRNVRGAMLAYEADAWNAVHPNAPVAVHVLSVHFNAGSGGTLVLHQGTDVPAAFRDRSVAYARGYVASVRPALNATGLLPYPLRLALGSGLSDDELLYTPPYRNSGVNPLTGTDRSRLPRRYAMLQASPFERDYAAGVLRYRGLT